MTSIDNEIATLHARIAQLEKEKNNLPPPTITPEKLLEQRLKQARIDKYSKSKESPVVTACRLSRESENEMLKSIVESIKTINSRIDMIESKMVIKEPSPSNEDVQLFNTLKKKRLELANAAGVPAFCIATNRSLRSMVSIKPKTLVELKKVFGFGQHKVSVYGQKFVDLIV